ncbi:MAG: hypothetical protein K9M13_02255, partial [Simkaniaceae bacterium]|nr:hypothetical protein [Simkaniaceae bacterium]
LDRELLNDFKSVGYDREPVLYPPFLRDAQSQIKGHSYDYFEVAYTLLRPSVGGVDCYRGKVCYAIFRRILLASHELTSGEESLFFSLEAHAALIDNAYKKSISIAVRALKNKHLDGPDQARLFLIIGRSCLGVITSSPDISERMGLNSSKMDRIGKIALSFDPQMKAMEDKISNIFMQRITPIFRAISQDWPLLLENKRQCHLLLGQNKYDEAIELLESEIVEGDCTDSNTQKLFVERKLLLAIISASTKEICEKTHIIFKELIEESLKIDLENQLRIKIVYIMVLLKSSDFKEIIRLIDDIKEQYRPDWPTWVLPSFLTLEATALYNDDKIEEAWGIIRDIDSESIIADIHPNMSVRKFLWFLKAMIAKQLAPDSGEYYYYCARQVLKYPCSKDESKWFLNCIAEWELIIAPYKAIPRFYRLDGIYVYEDATQSEDSIRNEARLAFTLNDLNRYFECFLVIRQYRKRHPEASISALKSIERECVACIGTGIRTIDQDILRPMIRAIHDPEGKADLDALRKVIKIVLTGLWPNEVKAILYFLLGITSVNPSPYYKLFLALPRLENITDEMRAIASQNVLYMTDKPLSFAYEEESPKLDCLQKIMS